MFGLGMGEIILIAIVALLVVGPERLPGAAKAIGKGIRDLRAQTKDLQQTIEQDTQIGDAVREIRGAMRGDPETLYKRATGEDFLPKDEPEADKDKAKISDGAADDESGETAKAPSSTTSGDESSAAKPPSADDSAAPPLPAPEPQSPKALPSTSSPKAIAEEFGITDSGWEEEASAAKAQPEVDPDLPVIRTPAGSMSRDDSAPSESAKKPDSESEHG